MKCKKQKNVKKKIKDTNFSFRVSSAVLSKLREKKVNISNICAEALSNFLENLKK